jgi:hypothetical protein
MGSDEAAWSSILQAAFYDIFEEEFDLRARGFLTPGLGMDVSVGYLHPAFEIDSFGVALGFDDNASRHLPIRYPIYEAFNGEAVIAWSRLLRISRSPSVGVITNAWRQEIGSEPHLALRQSQVFEPHCNAVGFVGGSPGAVARTGSGSIGEVGCAHVITPLGVGDQASLSGHGQGQILALDSHIDLAVVERNCQCVLTPRPLQRWPAPWMPCSLHGNVTTTNTARIAQITNTFGVFHDPLAQVWIDLDESGQPGDSSAPVTDNVTGHLCGIYRGSLTDPRGFQYGRCAHIQQAEQAMGLEFLQ